MTLILCGMMGSGKTTVSIKIAEITGMCLCDTDSVIMRKYGKISDIFEKYGEPYFRSLETETVKELSGKDGLVISTGGGLVLKEENVKLLKTSGKIIFLRAKIDTLIQRLSADKERPLLHNSTESLQDRLERLLKERAPIYERVADCIVDVDGKEPEKIAQEIVCLTTNK